MTETHDDLHPGRRSAVAIDKITRAELDYQRTNRRPSALTAREALAAMKFECLLVTICASNIALGIELTEDDYQRLLLAATRIERIATEVGV